MTPWSSQKLLVIFASLWISSKLGVPESAEAQVRKPFAISGRGVAPSGLPLPGMEPRSHWSVGQATHLGRYRGDGTLQTDSATFDPGIGPPGGLVGEFGSASPYVFTAANGNQLVCLYGRTQYGAQTPGTFQLTIVGVTPAGQLIVTAHFIAEFVVQPGLCTGRFAGVTGSWIMDAQTEPFVLGTPDPGAYSWEGRGSLVFPSR
jgi:hypothetical protein